MRISIIFGNIALNGEVFFLSNYSALTATASAVLLVDIHLSDICAESLKSIAIALPSPWPPLAISPFSLPADNFFRATDDLRLPH